MAQLCNSGSIMCGMSDSHGVRGRNGLFLNRSHGAVCV